MISSSWWLEVTSGTTTSYEVSARRTVSVEPGERKVIYIIIITITVSIFSSSTIRSSSIAVRVTPSNSAVFYLRHDDFVRGVSEADGQCGVGLKNIQYYYYEYYEYYNDYYFNDW